MATTVTLAILRNWFKDRAAGLADDLSTNELDDYLEYPYKYLIPHRVPGYLTDGEWSTTTTISVPDYDLEATIHSIRPYVLLNGNELATFTRIDSWLSDHDPTNTTEGQPDAALIYGTKDATYAKGFHRPHVRLYPIPDSSSYTISGAAKLYPTIDLSSSDGETLLEDQILVRAILSGATMERALDSGEDELAARERLRFNEALTFLRARSLTPAKERQYRRTF